MYVDTYTYIIMYIHTVVVRIRIDFLCNSVLFSWYICGTRAVHMRVVMGTLQMEAQTLLRINVRIHVPVT